MENEIPELPKKVDEEIVVEESKVLNNNTNNNDNEKHGFVEFVKDAHNFITTRNSKEIKSLALTSFFIAVLVIVLYVPVQFFRDLGINLLITFGLDVSDIFLDLWNGAWNIVYSVLGIALFYKLCKDRFYKLR